MSAEALEPIEEFFGGDSIVAVGLVECVKKVLFLFRGEVHRQFIVGGEYGHGCAFRKQKAIDLHLSVDDRTRHELHGRMLPRWRKSRGREGALTVSNQIHYGCERLSANQRVRGVARRAR